jgi:mRNA interferase MazF
MGSEIQQSRPCVIFSPSELHDFLRTAIVAPMTSGSRPAHYHIPITFGGRRGLSVLDQIRTVDKQRLVKLLGKASSKVMVEVLARLQELFAP